MASPRQPGGGGHRKRQPEGFGGHPPVPESAPPQPQRPPKDRPYVLPLAFLVPGLLCLALTAFLFSHSLHLLEHGLKAQGTVIGNAAGRGSKGGTVWYPIVRYTAQDGNTYEFESSSGSSPRSYDTGDRVELLYWAGDPEHATIRAFFPLWGGVLIVGIFGTVFTAAGVLLFYLIVLLPRRGKHRQRRRRNTGSP